MALLFRYLKEYRGTLILAMGLAAVNQIFSLLDPQIFRLLIDNYATRVHELGPDEFLRGVLLLLLASMGVAFVSRVAKNFQDYFANVMTQKVGARLYGDSVAHAFSLPYAVFEDQRSGELLQKLNKARADSQSFLAGMINIVFFSLVGIVFVLIYAFWVHWLIGLVFALIIPVVAFVTFAISRRVKGAQKKIVAETAELAGSTTETLRNVELVKSLGLDAQETERLNAVNQGILGLELKKVRLVRVLSFIQGTTINLVRTLHLFLMLWLILQGDITLGEFFSLLFYSFAIFTPLGDLGTVVTQYQEARASLEQIEGLLARMPDPKPARPRPSGPLATISFKDVGFSYAEGATGAAVSRISCTLAQGTTVGFVGPSGAGKSTVLKLLVGLYKPTEGAILVNGIPGTELDYDDFRRRIGYVSQETQLFAGTIRENLLFVRPGATENECREALSHASALTIVNRGDKGLDTKIGEGGIKISGGERQRLAIARALLRNPELIIFDEATSSLDSMTERAITDTIKHVSEVRPNLIVVLVAHRLSTVAHADTIYVLERGTISEKGTHGALLKKKGLYAALWREQSALGNGAEDDDPREARANGRGPRTKTPVPHRTAGRV